MARYLIESVQYGEAKGGMACGPVPGPIAAELKLRTDSGKEFFMTLAEYDGSPNFYRSAESTFELHIKPEDVTQEQINMLDSHYMSAGCYEDIFEEQDPEWYQLYRYLIYLVRGDEKSCRRLVRRSKGKYLDEIEVPASDIELEYLEEREEEEE